MDKEVLRSKSKLYGKILSTPEEIRRFIDSSIYKDYINELDLRLAETTVMLDDFDTKFTGRQYDTFRGRKRNLLEMKELFIDMVSNKISDDSELEEGESNVN
jgi:hypothetical protein